MGTVLATACAETTSARAHRPGRPLIADLELVDAARPSWVTPDMRLRVPLPSAVMQEAIGGEPLVFGRLADGGRIALLTRNEPGVQSAFSWTGWAASIRLERYATWRQRPLHTRLPVSYQRIPSTWRHRIAGWMYSGADTDEDAFPSAPFDAGFEVLRAVAEGGSRPGPSPRVCLTHDVDTADGFDWAQPIAELEFSLGVRSSWNIVARGYPTRYDVLDWLVERGFEIGLHDLRHDNRLIYLSEDGMRRRLDLCRPFLKRYDVRGFRSPSWLRSEQLYRVLPDYVQYDSSSLDFDWLCPAGRGGVLTATPFAIGQLIEIPVTLPWEAPMLTGGDADRINDYWASKVDWLVSMGGQAVVNTHPDPHYSGSQPMIRQYGQFLETLLSRFGGRWSLPRELAAEVPADA